MTRIACAVVCWFAWVPCAAANTAEDSTERMLSALGGRTAWAALTTLVNDSWQYRIEAPSVVRAVIRLDLQRPRFQIETTGEDLHLIRAVDQGRGWRFSRAGQLEPLPEATLTGDLRWYAGHVYRTIHRLARRDAALRVALGADGRLEVYDAAARIAWFRLDSRGEPFAFGGFDDEEGSVSGPWNHSQSGIRHPSWVARRDGSLRSVLVKLETPAEFNATWVRQPQQMLSWVALRGQWTGRGTFGGKDAQMDLQWEPLPSDRFWRLVLVYKAPDGTVMFRGEALYSRSFEGIVAHWFDSTGNRYRMTGQVEGPCMTVNWGREGEAAVGRSRYCLDASQRLTVRDDSRIAPDVWQPFAQFELTRPSK